MLLALCLPGFSPAGGAQAHFCKGDEANHYGYFAPEDKADRSEQEHVCRCRRERRQIRDAKGALIDTSDSYYDPSRDLCLDNFIHFQCLEKGGDWMCPKPGKCLCNTKPPHCQDSQLSPWRDVGCGQGDCEDTHMLQGRDPTANCRGGKRWQCVANARCALHGGRKVCKDADFTRWRMIGCGVRGCAKGQMAWARDRKTYLECDAAMSLRCQTHPACR